MLSMQFRVVQVQENKYEEPRLFHQQATSDKYEANYWTDVNSRASAIWDMPLSFWQPRGISLFQTRSDAIIYIVDHICINSPSKLDILHT